MINVLFSSVGRRVELIRLFREAYGELDLRGKIVGLDIDPLAPALQEVDVPYLVPRLNNKEYPSTLIQICQQEHVDLVFPLIDPGIPVLADISSRLEEVGTRVVVIHKRFIDKTSDKWKTFQLFRELEIPTPMTWLPEEVDAVALDFPVFVKPRFGSAGEGTHKIENDRDLDYFLNKIPQPVIQEYLPGPEITNDVVCDLKGNPLAVVSRQRIEVRWGEVAKGVTIYDEEITEGCLKIAKTLNAVGPITVQCMMKEGKPHFTEINPRFGGGVPLGVAAGANYPKWLLAKAAGIEIDIPAIGSYQKGLYLTRFDDAHYLSKEDYDEMASRHF